MQSQRLVIQVLGHFSKFPTTISHLYLDVYVYIYIYIHIERERERDVYSKYDLTVATIPKGCTQLLPLARPLRTLARKKRPAGR